MEKNRKANSQGDFITEVLNRTPPTEWADGERSYNPSQLGCERLSRVYRFQAENTLKTVFIL